MALTYILLFNIIKLVPLVVLIDKFATRETQTANSLGCIWIVAVTDTNSLVSFLFSNFFLYGIIVEFNSEIVLKL